jgi:hypothetical protein
LLSSQTHNLNFSFSVKLFLVLLKKISIAARVSALYNLNLYANSASYVDSPDIPNPYSGMPSSYA